MVVPAAWKMLGLVKNLIVALNSNSLHLLEIDRSVDGAEILGRRILVCAQMSSRS